MQKHASMSIFEANKSNPVRGMTKETSRADRSSMGTVGVVYGERLREDKKMLWCLTRAFSLNESLALLRQRELLQEVPAYVRVAFAMVSE
jgi:hypothetical protein